MRARPIITSPSVGTTPLESPVPAPRGMNGIPFPASRRTTRATSSVLPGKTTARGSFLKMVLPSHS